MVEIASRNYQYTYSLDKEKYEGNGIINANGTLNISAINENIEGQAGKTLMANVALKTSTGDMIDIPQGSKIIVNSNRYEVNYGNSRAVLVENLTNNEIQENLNLALDMSDVLQQNRLSEGTYEIKLEFVLSNNNIIESTTQGEVSIPFTIIDYGTSTEKESYGISTEIISIEGIEADKLQLIKSTTEETREIRINYEGTIETPYVNITILEKTGEFQYSETDNTKKITLDKSNVSGTIDGQTVRVTFGEKLNSGTYRILFELYDRYGTKKSEDFANFIVY